MLSNKLLRIIRTYKLIILIIFSILPFSKLQAQDVDKLGNLWIFTLDKSRSMTDKKKAYQNYVFSRLLNNELFSQINFLKDEFIFYDSGIIYMPDNYNESEIKPLLIRENNIEEHFTKRFIRQSKRESTPVFLKDTSHFKKNFRTTYGSWTVENFPYTKSFVSLIRPLTLASFLQDYEHLDLLKYNNIILCTITDDADQNDQWLTDYKTIRKFIPKKQEEIDNTLNTLIYNSFNSKSNGHGEFKEVFPPIEKIDKPKIFAYSYQTKQGLLLKESDVFSIKIEVQQNDSISLMINEFNSKNHIVKLDSILLNGNLLKLSYPLIIRDIIIEKIPADLETMKSNTISLYGFGQQIYKDSLLGNRIRKVIINETHTPIYAPSHPLHTSTLRSLLVILISIIILLISYFVFNLYRVKCIIIGPLGKRIIIRNGFKYFKKKKKIQYAAYVFFPFMNTSKRIKLKNHFIKNDFLVINNDSEKKWITILSKKALKLKNNKVKRFEKRSSKSIQGLETIFHNEIREKYNSSYHIYFLEYPSSETSVHFSIENDRSQNEYSINMNNIESAAIPNSIVTMNQLVISDFFIRNTIPTYNNYIMLCNELIINDKRFLTINLIETYTLKAFFPVRILKKYSFSLNENDSVEKIIKKEKIQLRRELKLRFYEKIKTHYNSDNLTRQEGIILPVSEPLFPINLYLCSDEQTDIKVKIEIYNSITDGNLSTIDNVSKINIERPRNLFIEPYSMQLLWYPHSGIYSMNLFARKQYAINGENDLDVGNPDMIDVEIVKTDAFYTITICQGKPLKTNIHQQLYILPHA